MKSMQKLLVVCMAACLLLSACGQAAGRAVIEIDSSTIDFASSEYKHLNNGGITEDETLPYNIEDITGATLTV